MSTTIELVVPCGFAAAWLSLTSALHECTTSERRRPRPLAAFHVVDVLYGVLAWVTDTLPPLPGLKPGKIYAGRVRLNPLSKRLVPAPVATLPSVPPASGVCPAPAHPGHSAAQTQVTLRRRAAISSSSLTHGAGHVSTSAVVPFRGRCPDASSCPMEPDGLIRMQGSTAASRPNLYPCHTTTLDLDAHVSRAAPDNNGSATSARAGHLLDAHVECLFFSVGAESASTPGEPSRLFGQRQRTPQSTSRLFCRRGAAARQLTLVCLPLSTRPLRALGTSSTSTPRSRPFAFRSSRRDGNGLRKRPMGCSPSGGSGAPARPRFSASMHVSLTNSTHGLHAPWASPTLLSPNCAVPPEYGHPP
ncbi:hypothetical protein B0H14DRAFT_3855490 [Mycena olivaceomarginata]|nr:hypothetical protein B0H14DRAFT_3855490 [Mycena olivaceomarginata]